MRKVILGLYLLAAALPAFSQSYEQFEVGGFGLNEDQGLFQRNAARDRKTIENFNRELWARGAYSGMDFNPISDWKFGPMPSAMNMQAAGAMASVPGPMGRVVINFLCDEEGSRSYEVSMSRRFEHVTAQDIADGLRAKYGKPTLTIKGRTASGKPSENEWAMIWTDQRSSLPDYRNLEEPPTYKGPGLGVRITGYNVKQVYLHLLSIDGAERHKHCQQIMEAKAHAKGKANVKF